MPVVPDTNSEIDTSAFASFFNDDVPTGLPSGRAQRERHREKDHTNNLRFGVFDDEEAMCNAMSLVALPLKPREWRQIPEAKAAVDAEYEKLRKRGAWDESGVMEWDDVVTAAKKRAAKEG